MLQIDRLPTKRRLGTFALVAALFGGCESDPQVVNVSTRSERVNVPTWEEFATASTFPGSRGPQYVVEGDLPIATLQELHEYYYEHYVLEVDKLAVRQFNNADDAWSNGDQRALEYCVSTTFPASGTWSRTNTIAAMATAAARWRQVANIRFDYVSSRDSDCVSGSSIPHSRFFKVAPKALAGGFACAFFPVSRGTCPELDGSTVGADTSKTPPLSITRTLTHELGHVLGMSHEYQRADSPDTSCGIDTSRNLTTYDSTSIMQASIGACGGSPMETLSASDGIGARALYRMPPAWHASIHATVL